MASITPRDGAWNMRDQKFFRPVTIEQWMVVIYERPQRFQMETVNNVIRGLGMACEKVGITVQNRQPEVFYENGNQDVIAGLKRCGGSVKQKSGKLPTLIVAIMPEGSADIYSAIKHFGDIQTGVATQCLKSAKVFRANDQYWANVLLKVNVKLGGINTIPAPQSAAVLTDPANPTVVMGADVIHPAPGSTDRPSFTGLVGNIDSNNAKYVASMRVQTSRQEMIDDVEDMAKEILNSYLSYRKTMEKVANAAPKRLIFFRDGVSEGQFAQVIDQELPRLKAACAALKISPKITIIVVGKRHHVRFFPQDGGDRSGNCPAGTVVDTDIAHPVEFDYYLQSHAGLLGTSRPSHYNVLYDENAFTADSLQQLSFTLCHVYARSTRSVSIPAPVYYADIVCSRAKNHFDPAAARQLHFSESGEGGTETGTAGSDILERYRQNFRPLHPKTAQNMYFS
jgi:eukaryotic translation initiation factor 2C